MSETSIFKCKACKVPLKAKYNYCWGCRIPNTNKCEYFKAGGQKLIDGCNVSFSDVMCDSRVAKPYKFCYDHSPKRLATPL